MDTSATSKPSLLECYKACMILAGVGDAFGYRNGSWEFNKQGKSIHNELELLGGIDRISLLTWSISDDQVMHIHTALALIKAAKSGRDVVECLAEEYIESFKDMSGRAPGPTTAEAIHELRALRKTKQSKPDQKYTIPFNKRGGGCGGSMRSMCIGLLYVGESEREELVRVSIESGRLTHNHPTGFLGAMCSSLFTAYAIERIPIIQWGTKLVNEALPISYKILEKDGRDWGNYQNDLKFFESKWRSYLSQRGIENPGAQAPIFPTSYDVNDRDHFYKSVSFQGWGGSSGHDSVIIAYDALLGAQGDWGELVRRGILHGGDSDSTGCICAAWYGAFFGLENVPKLNYAFLEYRSLAEELGEKLFAVKHGQTDIEILSTKQKSKEEVLACLEEAQRRVDTFEADVKRFADECRPFEATDAPERELKLLQLARFCSIRYQELLWLGNFVDSKGFSEIFPQKVQQMKEQFAKVSNMCNNIRTQLFEIGIRETQY